MATSSRRSSLAAFHRRGDALKAASDWAFDRDSPATGHAEPSRRARRRHRARALRPGRRRRPRRTRTWSTAKSIGGHAHRYARRRGAPGRSTSPLRLRPGSLEISVPGQSDPRSRITLRHVLNMSSGLYHHRQRGASNMQPAPACPIGQGRAPIDGACAIARLDPRARPLIGTTRTTTRCSPSTSHEAGHR